MTAWRAWSAASLAVVGLAASAARQGSARAEALHPQVIVELEQCEPPLAVEVRRIVGVELRATVIDSADARDAATRVVATCRGFEVDLSLVDAITAKQLGRTVALAEAAPAARARLLALAVAELVVAGRQEIESAPARTKELSPPPAPPPARAPHEASEAPARAVAEALGVARAFPESGLWLLGAGARGGFTLAPPLMLTLEVTAEWGKTSRATGQVAARAIGGALGLGWGIERRWVLLLPWVGARAGVVRLTGEPRASSGTSGGTQSGPWLGPELGIAATWFPHAPVHAMVGLSAGALLLGVRGQVVGDSNVNVLGAWASLVVGVGLAKP